MNTIHLLGRLGHDPSHKEIGESKLEVVEFSLATNHKRKQGDEWVDETVWHRIKCFGKRAGIIKQYVSKGDQLQVTGRQENRKYEDKDGNTKWASEVILSDFNFVGGKKEEVVAETTTGLVNEAPTFDEKENVPF